MSHYKPGTLAVSLRLSPQYPVPYRAECGRIPGIPEWRELWGGSTIENEEALTHIRSGDWSVVYEPSEPEPPTNDLQRSMRPRVRGGGVKIYPALTIAIETAEPYPMGFQLDVSGVWKPFEGRNCDSVPGLLGHQHILSGEWRVLWEPSEPEPPDGTVLFKAFPDGVGRYVRLGGGWFHLEEDHRRTYSSLRKAGYSVEVRG